MHFLHLLVSLLVLCVAAVSARGNYSTPAVLTRRAAHRRIVKQKLNLRTPPTGGKANGRAAAVVPRHSDEKKAHPESGSRGAASVGGRSRGHGRKLRLRLTPKGVDPSKVVKAKDVPPRRLRIGRNAHDMALKV